jgi:hypothetical protein
MFVYFSILCCAYYFRIQLLFLFIELNHIIVKKFKYLGDYTKHNNFYADGENLVVTKIKDSTCYQIGDNTNTEKSKKMFLLCEITIDNKTYDITSNLKCFFIVGNKILNRRFITYIMHYRNVQLPSDKGYEIIYMDSSLNKREISSDNVDDFEYVVI